MQAKRQQQKAKAAAVTAAVVETSVGKVPRKGGNARLAAYKKKRN